MDDDRASGRQASRSDSANALAAARDAERRGNDAAAAKRYAAAVAADPDSASALNGLGMCHLRAGNHSAAVEAFERAVRIDPGAAALWTNLATAQRGLGDDEGERRSLSKALQIDATDLVSLVRKAQVEQRLGDPSQATQTWTTALAGGAIAPSLPRALEEALAEGRAFVRDRTEAFSEEVGSALAVRAVGIDSLALSRFNTSIDGLFGRRKFYQNQCAGLHFPFLPADEFFARSHFPWMAALESRTDAIRAEALALLSSTAPAFEPYVSIPPGSPRNVWSELSNSPRWDAYHLIRYGEVVGKARERCPDTLAALSEVPQARLAGRAPSAFFSVLRPRTRIPPHTGVTNTRAIVHLPLVVPEGCGFRVGGEVRRWREGEAFAFDDTIEHEAWNEGTEERLVLILDVWNPHLTAVEIEMLEEFFSVAERSEHNPMASPSAF